MNWRPCTFGSTTTAKQPPLPTALSEHEIFLAQCWTALGGIEHGLRRFEEAEIFHRRALSVLEKHFGTEHPERTVVLQNIARALYSRKRYVEAEVLMREAIALREKLFGPAHSLVVVALEEYAVVLRKLGRKIEAKGLDERIRSLSVN